MTDYKALLIAYMANVIDCEGRSFIDDSISYGFDLTTQQRMILLGIEQEVSAMVDAHDPALPWRVAKPA